MTSSRKKLPGYGKALLQQRESGIHPERVWVIYGQLSKDRPTDAPYLWVDENYAPDVLDWSVVAGVPVEILWRHGGLALELVAEIARFAAPVSIHYVLGGKPVEIYAPAFLYRALNDPLFTLWDEALERDYDDRLWNRFEAQYLDMQNSEKTPNGG